MCSALFFSSSSARESRLLLRLEGKQTAEMSSLGLNFCYPPGIGVARPKSATPFITSQFHLAKALSSSRLLLSPSTSGAPHRRLPAPPSSISTASTAADDEEGLQEELAEEEEDGDPTVEVRFLDRATEPGSITEWELDFCSRPILDDRGKKLWELVVCDSTLSLQFTRFFPNNVINSVTLKDAIASISDKLGVPLPERIRFFRSQMQTIITRACNELGIKPIPSKRCLSLILWLEERYETVYTRHPGFQQGSKPLLTLDNPFPMELPDNLFGEKWAFVQLPFSAVVEEMSSFETRYAFGGSLDFELLGFEIDDNTLVPGLAVASSRAKPLAAWMNGLEICSVEADISRACLILSVGVSTRYTYATYPKNASTTKEAEAWEAAKKACGGLHFLAIQEELDSEDCVGFWLLLDLPPPPV
ncbi:protein TAB2 homolog, chloroplastic-like [Zingiber officinale]|uniref:protein TAB2 homolog, chloroplastic-like n=1 Tax=Zingiber officinale TaxID=94328 RepID=UPI001C4B8B49|nr:protein TAB2 homolog, chloroplastic-like [Zingiber officinale]